MATTTHTIQPSRAITVLSMYFLVAVLAGGCHNGEDSTLRVTGTIEGTTIGVGSRVGGRIAEVGIKEGDAVTTTQVLVKLECGEQQAALNAANAKVAQAQATLERLENGARPEELAQAKAAAETAEAAYMMALSGARSQEIAAARATADAAKAQLDTAASAYDRIKKLREGAAVSQQAYDTALHRFEAAQNQH